MPLTKNERSWIGGLISNAAAGVTGVFSSITADMVTGSDWSWKRCLIIAGVSMAVHVFGFLQKSPLPEVEETETTTTVKLTETTKTETK